MATIPPMQRPFNVGGYLTFHPWVDLSSKKQEQLTSILIGKELIEGDENGELLYDWRLAGKAEGGQGYTHRSEIALRGNGGDWEEPTALFYRRNSGSGTNPEEVHIPPQEHQRALHEEGLGSARTLPCLCRGGACYAYTFF